MGLCGTREGARGPSQAVLESRFFTFAPDGRIVRYRPIMDTAAFMEAFTAA